MGNGSLLLISIENYLDLVAVQGESAADEIQVQIQLRVAHICGGKGGLVGALGAGQMGVCWEMSERGAFIQQDEMHRDALVDEIHRDLQDNIGGMSACRISVKWVGADVLNQWVGKLDHAWPPHHGAADVAMAELVYTALKEDRATLEFEPVCCVFESSTVLYFEALIRVYDESGGRMLPGAFIPALERLGLMRCLDRYVVLNVIQTLERHPDIRLGVNISAQSAVNDVWWRSAFANLIARPEVARRLVVEITETARLRAGMGGRFCRHLQRLGCQIAIDDFGAGFAADAISEVKLPDVIKIDRRILHRTREAGQEGLLEEVLSAAHAQCSLVVVEGVESDRDRLLVARSGGRWAQGHFLNQSPARFPS